MTDAETLERIIDPPPIPCPMVLDNWGDASRSVVKRGLSSVKCEARIEERWYGKVLAIRPKDPNELYDYCKANGLENDQLMCSMISALKEHKDEFLKFIA